MQFKTVGKKICFNLFSLSFADTFYYLNQIFSLTRKIPVCSFVTFNTARHSVICFQNTLVLKQISSLLGQSAFLCDVVVQLQWMTHLFQVFLPPVDKLKKININLKFYFLKGTDRGNDDQKSK